MLKYLKNAWYAAAYSHEVTEDPFRRTLIDRPMVLFRGGNGEAGMLPDRCPHRFAPLSEGKVVEGTLQCPYHGLRFDTHGRCVLNPHSKNKAPLKAADMPCWPVLEKYGMIWFWPGDAEKADAALLPRIEFLEQPEDYAVVRGRLHVRGNYELVTDNLLDLSHAVYLHPQFAAPKYSVDELLAATKQRLERKDRSIINHRMRSGLGPPVANVELFGMDEDTPVHSDTTMTWHPPAILDFSFGSWEMDKPRESGVLIPQMHVITPETEFTSHYFFVNGRNARRDDPEVDKIFLEVFRHAFGDQDEPMIEKVQLNMGDVSDINELGPVLLQTDSAPVSARRLLAELIAQENS